MTINHYASLFTNSAILFILSLQQLDGWVITKNNNNLITTMESNKISYRSLSLESSSSLHGSSSSSEEKMDRMEIIRSLQNSFYSTTAIETDKRPSLDLSKGIYTNLPLWRVNWTELPGRTNVLHVHDPRYTNMFEKIMHMDQPYYFGHLYLEKGSKALSKNNDIEEVSQLMDYEDYDMEEHGDGVIGSAVLGTLMRITDYRRIDDGRLLIFVQAIERFVVLNVHQELPYGVVDVQLLPDIEEVYYKIQQDSDINDDDDQNIIPNARALAIRESLDTYLDLEFENTILSLPNKHDELSANDIYYSSIMEVLPYARYSGKLPITNPCDNNFNIPSSSPPLPQTIQDTIFSKQMSPLEYHLKKSNIINQPCYNKQLFHLSTNELEIQLWIVIDLFLQRTPKPLSVSLLSLLPKIDNGGKEIKWPKTFFLLTLINNLNEKDKKEIIDLSAHNYPSYRRQKRFSYSVGLLLENVNELTDSNKQLFRHTLLRIPSAHGRFIYLLHCFQEKL